MNKKTLSILILALILASCAAPTPQATEAPQLANPASQNCIVQGGTLAIEKRGDEGEFGVCYFEDNMQCEEWALMRGECPVGGVKVTGYASPAARYCAITGGEYAVTGNRGAEDELGTGTFKDGSQCDSWEYYNGRCAPGEASAPPPLPDPGNGMSALRWGTRPASTSCCSFFRSGLSQADCRMFFRLRPRLANSAAISSGGWLPEDSEVGCVGSVMVNSLNG